MVLYKSKLFVCFLLTKNKQMSEIIFCWKTNKNYICLPFSLVYFTLNSLAKEIKVNADDST